MSMRRLSERILGRVALLAFVLLASAVAVQAAEPLRIGAFVAVTGSAATLGAPEARTLRLYVDRTNAAGGAGGRPLQLVLTDTGSDPAQALVQAQRLIETDKVELLIGGTTTDEAMAVLKLVEARQVPFIALAGGFGITEPARRWVFATPHSDTMAVTKIFDEMKQRKLGRIAVVAGSRTFDQMCRGSVRQLAAEHGITIVAEEVYGAAGSTPQDLNRQLGRIKATAGVQALLGCGFGDVSALLLQAWHDQGMTKTPLYLTHGSGSQHILDLAKGVADGARVPLPAAPIAEQLPDDDPQATVGQAYRDAYRKAFNEPVSSFGGHAHDALLIATEALKRGAAPGPAGLREAIEKTKGLVGVGGTFSMSPTDHRGLTAESLRMVEVKNGVWVLTPSALVF